MKLHRSTIRTCLPAMLAALAAVTISFSAVTSSRAADAPTEATIERRMLLPGSEHATEVLVKTASQAGPTVVIVGGVHGDEPAGAAAAVQISRWPLSCGTLVCIPRANVTALAAGQRRLPETESKLSDLNRNFPRVGEAAEPRGDLARALWQVVAEAKPDWLIDLHEGFAIHRQNAKSVGSSIISDKSPASVELAREMVAIVNETLQEEERFSLLGPPVNGSLARAAHEQLGAQAMILETTYRGVALPVRARQHRLMVHRLLRHMDMLPEDVTTETGLLPDGSPEAVRVALYNDGGVAGKGVPRLLDQLADRDRYRVAQICGADVAAGALRDFDVLICSGGSGSGQARSLGEQGREEVRRFVSDGGDYVGICAGSYLACGGFSWGLGILDAKTVSPRWRRGRAELEVTLTEEARQLWDHPAESVTLLYQNGPILQPLDDPAIPDYRSLATFAEEVAEHESPAGVMVGSPAVVWGDFGRGQVLCISPHPEQSARCEQWLPRAVRHLAELKAIAP